MSGEKTELPTNKKKDDAKNKGQVINAKEIGIVLKLICFLIMTYSFSEMFYTAFNDLVESLGDNISYSRKYFINQNIFDKAFNFFIIAVFPILISSMLMGMIAAWLQSGFVVASEALVPSFRKLNPVDNIKNIFSKKSFIALFYSVLKILIASLICWYVIRTHLEEIINSYRLDFHQSFVLMFGLLVKISIILIIVMMFFSLLDWINNFFHYLKSLKMSKKEIKDENKELYGNPIIKSRQRQISQSILNSSLNRVGDAKVVVANPTHISVALDYEPGRHDLPYIVAMGQDDIALEIRKIANKNGIPVIVNVQLARMLYLDCETEEYIKEKHIKLAAEIFKSIISANQLLKTKSSSYKSSSH